MIEIIDTIDQMSPEWNTLRIGSIGGSSISKAVAKGQGKTRKQLMYDMVGEILSSEKKQVYMSHEMAEGIKYEPKARAYYSMVYGVVVREIALIKDGAHKHVSPDGLVGGDGMIEIKTAIPSVFVETKDTGKIATDRRRQIQWSLKRAQRQWCDYVMYCPYLKEGVESVIVIRIDRDEKEIEFLEAGADEFIDEMVGLFLRIKD